VERLWLSRDPTAAATSAATTTTKRKNNEITAQVFTTNKAHQFAATAPCCSISNLTYHVIHINQLYAKVKTDQEATRTETYLDLKLYINN